MMGSQYPCQAEGTGRPPRREPRVSTGDPVFLEVEVRGIVQGVGFRPFVFRLAEELGLAGEVRNTPEGVLVRAAGTWDSLQLFLQRLREEAPPASLVEEVVARETGPFQAGEFRIVSSGGEGEVQTLVSPDLATCPDCLREIMDSSDRRFRYPFTNCTNCGPRFTIIRRIPYDRPHTSMASFEMCEECRREYEDPRDRRFHAQPNACPRCGPRLWLAYPDGREIPGDPIFLAAELLREGHIVAVKGLGGFQLACDATNDEAVRRLRERKGRYAKPFAVMVRDLEEARTLCEVSREEEAILASPRSPIVLLCAGRYSYLSPLVAPGLVEQGIFLPYTPLHHLLLREVGTPLVMTSGNASDEPIARDNREALERLGSIADFFLLHDRDILVRYDDSVVRVVRGAEYPIRRARGYAPYPVSLRRKYPVQVLALGPELKNTFCFLRGEHAFLGQHIGDMDHPLALRHYEEALRAMRELFSLEPEVVACDIHPEYLTTELAPVYAGELSRGKDPLPVVQVQHHHAHLVSCLADSREAGPSLGVTWDGTGYGEDGTVWGGEFLWGDERRYRRLGRLLPFPMPGGEVCTRRIYRMAFGVLLGALGEVEALVVFERLFPHRGKEAQAMGFQAREGVNTPLTSSAGRLFDAVACLLGVGEEAHYEAQAACELEALARQAPRWTLYPYRLEEEGSLLQLDTRPLVRAVLEEREAGRDRREIAASFHRTLAVALTEVAVRLAEATGTDRVALTGGSFQNLLLLTWSMELLEERGLHCLIHRRVPCNDGGVSLGQAVVAAARREDGMV